MSLSKDAYGVRTDQLLEALNTAVILLNESLHLTYLNPAAENLFEVSRRQVHGQYWPQVMQADERMRKMLRATEKPIWHGPDEALTG